MTTVVLAHRCECVDKHPRSHFADAYVAPLLCILREALPSHGPYVSKRSLQDRPDAEERINRSSQPESFAASEAQVWEDWPKSGCRVPRHGQNVVQARCDGAARPPFESLRYHISHTCEQATVRSQSGHSQVTVRSQSGLQSGLANTNRVDDFIEKQ